MNTFYYILAIIWGVTALLNGFAAGLWVSNGSRGLAAMHGVVGALSVTLVILFSGFGASL